VSNFCQDEQARDFSAFFDNLHQLFLGMETKPAVLLLHHSRKPKSEDKAGRALLNLISGHQTIQRRSRTIVLAGRVTEGFKENRLAVVALKVSNNGELEGDKRAIQLSDRNTMEEIPDFDWSIWEKADDSAGGAKKDKSKVRLEHLQEVFNDGALTRHEAGQKLEAVTGAGRSAVSEALNKRFADMLEKMPGGLLINLKPEHRPEPSPFDEGAED